MRKVAETEDSWVIKCGPCNRHYIPKGPITSLNGLRISKWEYNGDPYCPTFTPSMNESHTFGEPQITKRCHFIITAGKINYCGDCSHGMAGQQNVELEPFTEVEFAIIEAWKLKARQTD